MTRLGIVEYFDQSDRSDPQAKRRRSLESAVLADDRGCSRVLAAEHHGPLSPSASPVLLAAVLAARTTRIRVGTAVSLLRVRDTYLTAVDFATLSAVAGDRVDVGLGRGDFAGPGSQHVEKALRKTDTELEEAFGGLRRFLLEGCESLAPVARPPEFWMHGTSRGSAELALRLGMRFSFGLFLKNDADAAVEAVRHYHDHGGRGAALAVTVVANRRRSVALSDAARVGDVAVNLVGGLEECAEGIHRLVELTGAEEVLLVELSDGTDDHLAAIDHLAESVA